MLDPANEPTWERMGYHGHLRIGEQADSGLAVRVDITDTSVILSDNSETLGQWDADAVTIERLSGDLFRLDLGDETFHFTAADRLTFGYEALDRLAAARAKLDRGIRGRLRKRRNSAQVQRSRLHLSLEEDAEPPTSHSAAAVIARGSGTFVPEAVENVSVGPTEDEPESAVEDFSDDRRPDVAITALQSLTAVSPTYGAAETNAPSNGAGNARSPQSQPNGIVEKANSGPKKTRRKHEEIRSSRLEEATMSAPPPPADPWEPGDKESPRQGSVPEMPDIGAKPTAAPIPPSVIEAAPTPPPPPPDLSSKPEAPSQAPPREPISTPVPAADLPIETDVVEARADEAGTAETEIAKTSAGDVAGDVADAAQPEVVIDLTNEPKARVGLIGRFRKKHEHSYTEDVVSGGIIRRVCSECHHVSIGAS